jgi:hypothetical protein
MFRNRSKTRLAICIQRALIPTGLIAVCLPFGAHAFQLDTPSDWQVQWDNTLRYNLGFRVKDVDNRIGNNPAFQQSDYKFSKSGDIVTNRVSLLSELDVVYQRRMGMRVSVSGWKDFAYDDKAETNPGDYAPGVPYSSIQSYRNGRYSNWTDRYFRQGGELLDAFVFNNFEVADKPVYLRAGQYTEYWGSTLFFPFEAISYSQGALDVTKLATSPGTEAKEAFLPRPQIGLTTQLSDQWSVSAQYFLGFDPNRTPDGGTFLGGADFLWQGPDFLSTPVTVPGLGTFVSNLPHGRDSEPDDRNDNYGLRAMWTSSDGSGALGMYYRHFDEAQPWVPWLTFGADGLPTSYRLAYNEGVDLFGLSYDTTIGNNSTSFELSYRNNTALNSRSSPLVPTEDGGARGKVINAVANIIVPLSKTALWNTGTLTAEMAYAHLLSVTDNNELYYGEDSSICTGGKWAGCSTKNWAAVAFLFQPQWLQVFPGVDLSLPISDTYGVYGNAAQLSGTNQGTHTYSAGIKATVRQTLDVTLAYNGYYAQTRGRAETPSGKSYYAGGNGPIGLNDRDWVSLTLKTSF